MNFRIRSHQITYVIQNFVYSFCMLHLIKQKSQMQMFVMNSTWHTFEPEWPTVMWQTQNMYRLAVFLYLIKGQGVEHVFHRVNYCWLTQYILVCIVVGLFFYSKVFLPWVNLSPSISFGDYSPCLYFQTLHWRGWWSSMLVFGSYPVQVWLLDSLIRDILAVTFSLAR